MIRGGAVSGLILMGATMTYGFCPKPTPRVCSEFFRSDAIFVGTVTSEEAVSEKDDPLEGWLYKLRVRKWLRGTASGTAVVHTSNDSGRLRLEVGHEYLLFAALSAGRLEIGDDCGPLSDPARAGEVMREIENLSKAADAAVEGEVVKGTASGPGVSGITVSVIGKGRVYRATTDAEGLFRVAVPPGRYRVDVDSKAAALSDLSPVDLSNVILVRGQCAQLQFIAP